MVYDELCQYGNISNYFLIILFLCVVNIKTVISIYETGVQDCHVIWQPCFHSILVFRIAPESTLFITSWESAITFIGRILWIAKGDCLQGATRREEHLSWPTWSQQNFVALQWWMRKRYLVSRSLCINVSLHYLVEISLNNTILFCTFS